MWTIAHASSEELVREYPNGTANLLIDGDIDTYWHSRWYKNIEKPPHELQINLGAKANINTLIITPRQKNSAGRCAKFEIKISDDGINWKSVKQDVIYWSSKQDFSNKTIHFQNPLQTRFISFVHQQSFNNSSADVRVGSLAELEINGTYLDPVAVPDFHLLNLKSFYQVGEKILLKNTTRSYHTKIKSLRWIANGAKLENESVEEVSLSYSKAGNYLIGMEVVDTNNITHTKWYKKRIRIVPAPAIDKRLLRVINFSDQDPTVNGYAYNVIDEGLLTRWITTWDELKPLPHYLIFDLGVNYDISGVSYLPSQNRGAVTDWQIHTSMDGENWGQPIKVGHWDNQKLEFKDVSWQAVKGRYLRFQINKTQPVGSNFANCADFTIYGVISKVPILKFSNVTIILLCLAFIILIGILLYFNRKKLKKNGLLIVEEANVPLNNSTLEESKTSISLFGVFRVMVNNQDITSFFFPKVKQLLAMLLIKNEGIYIKELTDNLWPGMNAEKAKNNRGTTIQHLKKAISPVLGLKLVYDKKKWSISVDERIYCDYFVFSEALQSLTVVPTIENIAVLKNILIKGALLKNIEAEWLDDIKQDLHTKFLNSTHLILKQKNNNAQFTIELAELVLLYDETDEIALAYLLTSLIAKDQLSLAKNVYLNFIKKYKQLYNQDFKIEFQTYLNR